MLPALYLYPPNPTVDEHGRGKPFMKEEYIAFQKLLETFGDRPSWNAKKGLVDAIVGRLDPGHSKLPDARLARLAVRVGLRQMHLLDDPNVVRQYEKVLFPRRAYSEVVSSSPQPV
jgi:hypothetical protein